MCGFFSFFFFKQKTAYEMRISDWSSDVCSSDLEGERYSFGAIDIRTTLRDLDPESLREQITTIEGDWYDASEVDTTVGNITDSLGNLGYAFVDVRQIGRA